MDSKSFAMKLLMEFQCAVAPGIAFNTADQATPEELAVLDSFCRVSLANSQPHVVQGIHRICDLLDSC